MHAKEFYQHKKPSDVSSVEGEFFPQFGVSHDFRCIKRFFKVVLRLPESIIWTACGMKNGYSYWLKGFQTWQSNENTQNTSERVNSAIIFHVADHISNGLGHVASSFYSQFSIFKTAEVATFNCIFLWCLMSRGTVQEMQQPSQLHHWDGARNSTCQKLGNLSLLVLIPIGSHISFLNSKRVDKNISLRAFLKPFRQ